MALSKNIHSPMSELEEPYLFEIDDKLVKKYGYPPAVGGKWLLFVGLFAMVSMWKKSCLLYRQGQFPGVKSIKCSTAKDTPKKRNPRKGVIVFHCGPYSDSTRMLKIGRNIVERLSYFNTAGYIPYKSDAQTALGTRATGNTSNSMYWLPVPKNRAEVIAGRENPAEGLNIRSGDAATTRGILDQALRLQEQVNTATGGRLEIQLVLDNKRQGSLSEYAPNPTEGLSNPSRIKDFKILDVLGYGGFAIVFRAYLQIDDNDYAIKRIPLPAKKERQERVLREVKVLAKLKHQNVVRYYSCWLQTHNTEAVRKFDQPWKQKLKDRCLTESFQTPVAESTTRPDSDDTLTHDSSLQDESDDELVVGMEYNVQASASDASSTSSSNLGKNSPKTDSHSSNIQFEVQEDAPPFKAKATREAPVQLTTTYLYIQMEQCGSITLKEWLVDNTERPKQTVLKFFLDIVNAVEHFHDKRMMHRDLKPSNVFFDLDDEFVVKVGDFGLGTIATEEEGNFPAHHLSPGALADQHTQNVGTFTYMAPEQRQRGKGSYTYKVDIFSMGLILFEMLWVMRTAQEKNRTLQDVRKLVFPAEFQQKHPEELALLKMMLQKDPNKRPTTRGIRVQPLLQDLQLPHSVNGIKVEEHFELGTTKVSCADGPEEDD